MVILKQNTVCVKGMAVQILTTLLITSTCLVTAVASAWPSYSLKVLESEESPLGYKISEYHSGLIGSLMMIGSLASPLVVAYSAEHFGRKKTVMLCGLSSVLGWSIKATAKSVIQIHVARLVMGVGYGMQCIIPVVYISEISQASLMGALCSVPMFMYASGIMVSYILGWLCSYDVIIYTMLASSVVLVLLMLLVKDSPAYLLRKGMEKEAIVALKFYRGASTTTPEIAEELEYLKLQAIANNKTRVITNDEEKQALSKESGGPDSNSEQSAWKIIRGSKPLQRALLNVAIIMVCTILMGATGVTTYAGTIFTLAAPGLSQDVCSVLLALALTAGCAVSIIIMDRVPRRTLMITSSLLAALCLAVLAGQLRWAFAPEWTAPLAVVLFAATYCIGSTNIPYVQLGECFPSEVKSFVTSVIIFCAVGSNFVVLLLFPYGVQFIGLNGTFFIFSLLCMATALISYCIMRETRNVPLETIQSTFEHGFFYNRLLK